MKSLKYIIAGFCLAALPGMEAMAQEVVKVDDPWKDYPDKKTLYKDYSRWSIGVNIGMPFYAGDFRSVSRGNNNWAGYMFGLQEATSSIRFSEHASLWTTEATAPVRNATRTTSYCCPTETLTITWTFRKAEATTRICILRFTHGTSG